MPSFSEDERKLLEPFVTNPDGHIYAVTGPKGMIGAIFARYSRAQGGFRETLLKEFIKEGAIDPAKADALIERVLIAFGDDSVGELEGAHLALEDISILSTKEWEDRRIGGSPIEQSTRYVFYDMRGEDGNWRYVRPAEIMASAHGAAYVETMDFIFDTYHRLVEPMKKFYMGLKPMETAEYDVNGDGVKEKYAELSDEALQKAFRITYTADIRTRACDTLRALLPLATKTNVGIFGNGRFFQHALSHCHTHPLPEVRDIATTAQAELEKIIPRYVKRAKADPYRTDVRARMRTIAQTLFAGTAPKTSDSVDLIGRGAEAVAEACKDKPGDAEALQAALLDEEDNLMLAQMLYPHLSHPLSQIREKVRGLPAAIKQQIAQAYLGDRKARRDRPGRAFESGYPYTFDLVADFGTYKDLERHRMLSQDRQAFTPNLGFFIPPDLVEAGFEADVRACVDWAMALYERLRTDLPESAAYATLHGSLVRWTVGINDRALMHLIELRTGPQGHPSYRKLCQEMHAAVAKRSAWRAAAMKFVDYGTYQWARGDAEAKQRTKEAELEKRM